MTDRDRRFLETIIAMSRCPDFDADMNNDDEAADKLREEANLARRIAEYLELNGFENLQDAMKKGWGNTRPLVDE